MVKQSTWSTWFLCIHDQETSWKILSSTVIGNNKIFFHVLPMTNEHFDSAEFEFNPSQEAIITNTCILLSA